ncbi:MAG: tetratricopeptide repeat protein [Flavobacteriales bacterium]|nr:tetratricopeptide repeat protein [Flavobacteriales bacterium]
MLRLLILLMICAGLGPSWNTKAQELDSLWRVWYDESLPDTARMQAMDYITFDHYMFNKPDTAYVLAGLVLDLARRKGNTKYEAWALNAQGASLQETGDYPRALDHFKRSLKIMEKRGDARRSAIGHSNVGNILHELGENAEAKIHFERSLELGRAIGDTASQGATLINYAGLLRESGDTTLALEMYQTATLFNEAPGRERNKCIALYNLGIVRALKKDYGQASIEYDRANELARTIGDADLLAMVNRGLGSMALRMGKPAEALAHGQRSLAIARSASLPWEMMESAHLVYDAYKALGNAALALPAYELHVRMRDSLQKEEDRVEVARANVRSAFRMEMLTDSLEHRTELAQMENERMIERLRADRNRNRAWGLGGGGVLLVGGISAFTISDRRRRQARYERDSAELEIQALRSQMNPHFIFNALNSISAFVQENATNAAVSFLARFARLMRLVLENSRHSEVPLKDDLEALDLYLHLERIRCKERFDYQVIVDPSLDPEMVLVPPLVSQPFVENAIWHGLAQKEDKGHLTIHLSKQGQNLLMIIEDDGIGRGKSADKAIAADTTRRKQSLGTAITQARLDLVGKKHGRSAGFRYMDVAQGTRVELLLPLRLDD